MRLRAGMDSILIIYPYPSFSYGHSPLLESGWGARHEGHWRIGIKSPITYRKQDDGPKRGMQGMNNDGTQRINRMPEQWYPVETAMERPTLVESSTASSPNLTMDHFSNLTFRLEWWNSHRYRDPRPRLQVLLHWVSSCHSTVNPAEYRGRQEDPYCPATVWRTGVHLPPRVLHGTWTLISPARDKNSIQA